MHSQIDQFCNSALGDLDFIISNPPYILSSEMDTLSLDIRCWEDAVALHGGVDGFHVIDTILTRCSAFLKPGWKHIIRTATNSETATKERGLEMCNSFKRIVTFMAWSVLLAFKMVWSE